MHDEDRNKIFFGFPNNQHPWLEPVSFSCREERRTKLSSQNSLKGGSSFIGREPLHWIPTNALSLAFKKFLQTNHGGVCKCNSKNWWLTGAQKGFTEAHQGSLALKLL